MATRGRVTTCCPCSVAVHSIGAQANLGTGGPPDPDLSSGFMAGAGLAGSQPGLVGPAGGVSAQAAMTTGDRTSAGWSNKS